MTTKEAEPFKGWALIELMGHRKRAGLCEDVSMFGCRLLRVDVPDKDEPDKFTTEFYGGSAIYGFHPCDESTGRRLARDYSYDRPIAPYHEPVPLALAYGHPDFEEIDTDNERG